MERPMGREGFVYGRGVCMWNGVFLYRYFCIGKRGNSCMGGIIVWVNRDIFAWNSSNGP